MRRIDLLQGAPGAGVELGTIHRLGLLGQPRGEQRAGPGHRRCEKRGLPMSDVDGSTASPDATTSALLATRLDGPLRVAALADAVVGFGPTFIGVIRRLAGESDLTHDAGLEPDQFEVLAREAEGLLIRWLTGERVTSRADEGERRVCVTAMLADANPDDPVFNRLAAAAILRLPPGHEDRDEQTARARLVDHIERSRRADDVSEQIMGLYYLLLYRLESARRSTDLIDDGLHLVGRGAEPAAVRDFLESAHSCSVVNAGEALAADELGEYTTWLLRAEQILAAAASDTVGFDHRIIAMRARQLDIAGDSAQAADAYADAVRSAPQSRASAWMTLSEATLRLQTGQHAEVVARLAPLLPAATDRYLTAVTEGDIADDGFLLGRAATLLAFAHAGLGDLRAALHVIDGAKSLRLRYRAALAEHPRRGEVIDVERAILAMSRGGEVPVALTSGTDTDLPLRTRLLERYRRLRPDLSSKLLVSPDPSVVAAALEQGEVAVLLGARDEDEMMLGLIGGAPASPQVRVTLLRKPGWSQWQPVFEEPGGWLDVLRGRPGIDGPAAVARLLDEVERGLGQAIADEIYELFGIRAGKLAVVPHRWLHLVPFWALPSLSDFAVSVFASAADLVASRSTPRPASGGGAVVVTNPTGDLPVSTSEAESMISWCPGPMTLLGPDQPIKPTVDEIGRRLAGAAIFHFSGHGRSDHLDPDRSALLVAPPPEMSAHRDPFIDWVAQVKDWQDQPTGERTADITGVGQLAERVDRDGNVVERRLDRGAEPSLYASYRSGGIRHFGELWSAGDMFLNASSAHCNLAFLSSCESGVAGGASSYVDEYGGLSAALRFAGVRNVVSSNWSVSESFAALYVDRFYKELAAGHADIVQIVRRVATWLREVDKAEVLDRLDELADAVRARSPRAAMSLEAYRRKIEMRGQRPFTDPWEWACFYATGNGTIVLPQPNRKETGGSGAGRPDRRRLT